MSTVVDVFEIYSCRREYSSGPFYGNPLHFQSIVEQDSQVGTLSMQPRWLKSKKKKPNVKMSYFFLIYICSYFLQLAVERFVNLGNHLRIIIKTALHRFIRWHLDNTLKWCINFFSLSAGQLLLLFYFCWILIAFIIYNIHLISDNVLFKFWVFNNLPFLPSIYFMVFVYNN